MSDSYEQVFENWRLRCEALEAKIQRLQNLQAENVTPTELGAVYDEMPGMVYFGRRYIAAVCRGMLKEVNNE